MLHGPLRQGQRQDHASIDRGVILLLERNTIFVTFAPTVDDTIRTALPKVFRLALIHHKKYFFKGGLTL